jgi:hypothetical protein
LSPTKLIIDSGWSGPNIASRVYNIFQCYYPMPADYSYISCMVNTPSGYRVNTNVNQTTLATIDPQRTSYGQIYVSSFRDYTAPTSGTVAPPMQVNGTGPIPGSGTATGYTYPINSIYVITVGTGGIVGTATFAWRQDDNATISGVITSNDPIELSNGVSVYWPDGTYVSGDVFIVQCTAIQSGALVRNELWPWPINAQYNYPVVYISRPPDLSDDNPAIPNNIPGYVILERALESAAMWPGTDTNKNLYYGVQISATHRNRFLDEINKLELTDDALATKDFVWSQMPYYPLPWADGSYLQSHAYYNGY